MRPYLLGILLAAVLLPACSDEQPAPRTVQALTPSNPIAEVKAETEKDPKNAEAWYHLADLYERNGMYVEEADALLKTVAIDPRRGPAYAKLGGAYNRLGRFPDAIAQFKKAIQLQPKNPVLYNNIAFSYGKTGKTDEQIASLKQAISIRPSYATARYNLGIVYLHRKDRSLALQQYAALKEIDGTLAESLKKEIDGGNRK